MADQFLIVYDGSERSTPWPDTLNGIPTRAFRPNVEGSWQQFLDALDDPAAVRGMVVYTPLAGLSGLMGGIKARYPDSFAELAKQALVLVPEGDSDADLIDPLKRLYGFRSMALSAAMEERLFDFVGTLFPGLPASAEKPPEEEPPPAKPEKPDYYTMLGLQPQATQVEVAEALQYYKQYWTDRLKDPQTTESASSALALIQEAEPILLVKNMRARYDAERFGTSEDVPALAELPSERDEAPELDEVPGPAAPPEDESIELVERSAGQASRFAKVAGSHPEVEVWMSTALAADPGAEFSAQTGRLGGFVLGLDDRRIVSVVTIGADDAEPPPRGWLGYYVRANLQENALFAASRALETAAIKLSPDDIALAVDLERMVGQFFKSSAIGRPFAVSPVVSLETWQGADTDPVEERVEPRRSYLGRILATLGLVALGHFATTLYQAPRQPRYLTTPVATHLDASWSIRGDGAVLRWNGDYDKVAVYRLFVSDPNATWQWIQTARGSLGDVVDAEPIRHFGVYRYLLVGSRVGLPQAAMSSVQSLLVRD
ncbi:MAG: hypothetical protein KGR26_04730 [Cyanobacteria bacterium REEB65]|nr:hypothetical protein [Cyanobacteria bacterium REEB65]